MVQIAAVIDLVPVAVRAVVFLAVRFLPEIGPP